MRRAILLAVGGALILGLSRAHAPLHAQSAPPDALSFFKNYFLTGDYVVAGVGLRGQGVNGIATGSIQVSGVPAGADIAAAFLYWQVVTKDKAPDSGSLTATFRNRPLASADGSFARQLGEGTSPCWSAGGGTGSSSGVNRTYSYRADVLRLFDVDESTGKFVVNGAHQVQLPDGGGATALGASLVIVFRDETRPLSAIVLYDGAFTMDQTTQAMSQRIQGFYQPATTSGTLSFIVGSGQENKPERLTLNGAAIANNAIRAAAGASWDNPTFQVTSPVTQPTVTAGIDHVGTSTFDCLTWAAVIYKTSVADTDGDGLLDVWETATAAAPVADPRGRALPPLADMGANPNRKDVFMELGYMDAAGQSYGGATKPAHSHLPPHATLKLIGDAFKAAPEPIAIHFDAGNDYPAGDALDAANNAEEYLIRGAGLARGGEGIPETATVCQRGVTDAPWVCQYSAYPGTVGWKTGFRFLRDEVLSVTPPPGIAAPPASEDACSLPGYTCNRRFDENRRSMFRYALFAHALGVPKSEAPCLDAANRPAPGDASTGSCSSPLRDNPAFHVPVTNTGVGDFPGGDVMVTLGAFNDVDGKPVGTPFMQASTLMHEFGHNALRRHGGEAAAPNCSPTYLSVMNYLYQLRGLLDDGGKPHLDFSRTIIGPSITETSVSDGSHSLLPYRLGWYAPLAGSYLDGLSLGASRHCNGTTVAPGEAPMVRIDARTAAGAIDWNANARVDIDMPLDVDFNGSTNTSSGAPEILGGSDDWRHLLLNQIGARRNTGALYIGPFGQLAVGPLSLDTGRGDLGRGDLGRGDLGRGDLGRGDLGRGDLGRGDLGRGDLGRGDLGQIALGRGDLGRGDLGGGDLFLNDPDNPSGELDLDMVIGTAKAPTNEFRACIIGIGTCQLPAGVTLAYPLHRVRFDWKSPNVGDVVAYTLYRIAGADILPGQGRVVVGTLNGVVGQGDYNIVDGAQLVNGAQYTYFIIATYADGTRSDLSNLITITAINDTPIGGNDRYTATAGGSLVVPAAGALSNDSDDDSPIRTVLIAGPVNGTLQLNADGSFTYVPAAGFAGTDSFVYGVTDGQATTQTTVSIEVKRPAYGFIGVQNLPATKPANLGSSVPLRWQFTLAGAVVDSSLAAPQIVICNAAGAVVYRGDPTDPGASSFQPPSLANGYTWGFNWQSKGIPAGTYTVFIGSLRTNQTFAAGTAFGPFTITLK